MTAKVTLQEIWDLMVETLENRGHHFEKMYRIEITWNEIKVWHDAYDEAGNPVMDKARGIPYVTTTRIDV